MNTKFSSLCTGFKRTLYMLSLIIFSLVDTDTAITNIDVKVEVTSFIRSNYEQSLGEFVEWP